MKRILRFEVKRAARSKGFLISLAMSCFIVILDFALFNRMYAGSRAVHNALEAWIGTDFQFAYNSLFYVLFPIIATLPFAGSYYTDLQSGYIKNICTRVSRKNYYMAKYCSTFLFAAIAVMLPLVLSLFLCMGIYPMRRPDKLLFITAGIIDVNLMPEIFNLYPFVYCILFILIDGVFAGMISVFSICIAERVESFFSAIAVPFAIYVLWGVLFAGNKIGNWSLMEMVNPLQRCITHGWQLLTCLLGGLAIAPVWIYLKGRKKDIL
ncbi:MAG: ABC transporter permease [Lachnospiraceae bacterium]|nr:ABC transporter permease [Lachnospiraceae bacterium]